jgi:hypothetical protein
VNLVLLLKDFMALTIELKGIRSLTTEIGIFKESSGALVEAVEFSEKTLVFQLPKGKLTVGALVSLTCSLHFDEILDFPITGKVQFCDSSAFDLQKVGIELRQYDRELWVRFLKAVAANQTRVDTLLASMKGEPRG